MEEFVANSALLAGRLTQQCEKAAADQVAAAADLKRAASEVGQGVLAGKAELAMSAKAAVREVLSQEIPAAIEAVDQAGDRLRLLVDQLARDQATTGAQMRVMGWKALGGLAIAGLVIIASTGYFAWTNVQRAEKASVEAEVLAALEQVAITSCDGTPCIKLEDGQARWQKNADYILIDSRPAAPVASP